MTTLPADVSADRVREYVERLSRPVQTRLAATLLTASVPAAKGRRSDQIAAAITAPNGIGPAVTVLPPDARHLLLVLVARGAAGDIWSIRQALDGRRDWESARFDTALAELRASGLVHCADTWNWTLLPGLVPALQDEMFAAIADCRRDDPEPPRFAFFLAALAAYCVESPPQLRQQGGFYVKWLQKAAERVAYPGLVSMRIESAFLHLKALGAVRVAQLTDRAVLRLAPKAAAEGLAASPEEIALASIESDDSERRYARVALAAIDRARAAGTALPGRADVVRAAGEIASARRTGRTSVSVADAHPVALAQGIARLRHLGLVAVEHADDGPRFSRRGPAESPAKWIVQPNFEVLVPEDAAPADVVRLGLVAELVRLDRVATFSITRASIERGAALVDSGYDPVAILASASATPVPENVAATVNGWNRRTPPLRPYIGAFIAAESPEQAEFLRAHAGCVAEAAPRVFVFAAEDLTAVLREAAKAGHPAGDIRRVNAWDREPDEHGSGIGFATGVRAAQAATRVRDEIDAWAKSAAPEPPPKAASAKRGGPAAPAGIRADPELRAFIRKFPTVHAAVARYPELLELAMGLDERVVRNIARDATSSDIRMVLEMVRDQIDKDAPPGPHGIGCTCDEHDEDETEDWDWDDEDDEDDLDEDASPVIRSLRALPGPRAEARRQTAPVAPVRPPVPAAAPKGESSAPWETPVPGELRRDLEEAARAGAWVEMLYVNSKGLQSPRTVRPVSVRDDPRPTLTAVDRGTNAKADYLLDRIAAVRGY